VVAAGDFGFVVAAHVKPAKVHAMAKKMHFAVCVTAIVQPL
jgi:hypothetical protein